MTKQRLQKIIARAGLASRRTAEEWITAGRVRVNGRVVKTLGTQADPRGDRIEVDGKRITAEDLVYVVLHKPRGFVSTVKDPEGRPTVADLVRPIRARLFPVGRLDFATSGVLLMTNDGALSHALLHPKSKVPKRYIVKLDGSISDNALQQWRTGIELEDGKTLPADVRRLRDEAGKSWLELTLYEGRNHQVRRMAEACGFVAMRLARVAFAEIDHDGLRPGQWRALSVEEMRKLKAAHGVPKRVRPQRELLALRAKVEREAKASRGRKKRRRP